MILTLCILLGILIISAKLLLNKVDKLGNDLSEKESIRGNFFGFIIFYTLFLILFFALITRDGSDKKQQTKEETKIECQQ